MKNNTRRIVLTGGPGGGKSTSAELIRREVGERIVLVPEAATMLYSGGFPRYDDLEARVATQKAIYAVQRNIEDVQKAQFPERVLLCDRGTLDGAAYWPKDLHEDFFQVMKSSPEAELDRYDAVVFFESAAVGDFNIIECGNPTRTESNKRAVELDTKLREIWGKHHHFYHIPHQTSFFKKIEMALQAVKEILTKF